MSKKTSFLGNLKRSLTKTLSSDSENKSEVINLKDMKVEDIEEKAEAVEEKIEKAAEEKMGAAKVAVDKLEDKADAIEEKAEAVEDKIEKAAEDKAEVIKKEVEKSKKKAVKKVASVKKEATKKVASAKKEATKKVTKEIAEVKTIYNALSSEFFNNADFVVVDRYEDKDMNEFNNEFGVFDYKTMRSSNSKNIYLIENIKDQILVLSNVDEMLKDAKKKQSIAKNKLNVIKSETVVFGLDTYLSFAPFTPKGVSKKAPYDITFATLKVVDKENNDVSSVTGSFSLDTDLKFVKGTVVVTENGKTDRYTFKAVDGVITLMNITSQDKNDASKGKTKKVIFEKKIKAVKKAPAKKAAAKKAPKKEAVKKAPKKVAAKKAPAKKVKDVEVKDVDVKVEENNTTDVK